MGCEEKEVGVRTVSCEGEEAEDEELTAYKVGMSVLASSAPIGRACPSSRASLMQTARAARPASCDDASAPSSGEVRRGEGERGRTAEDETLVRRLALQRLDHLRVAEHSAIGCAPRLASVRHVEKGKAGAERRGARASTRAESGSALQPEGPKAAEGADRRSRREERRTPRRQTVRRSPTNERRGLSAHDGARDERVCASGSIARRDEHAEERDAEG